MEPQNRRRGLHRRAGGVQTTLPLQPHLGTRLSQPKLRPNHRHRGDGHHRTGDKNRTELGRGLAAMELIKGVKQYANP